MTLTAGNFDSFHLAVHGVVPFAWQTRLLLGLVEDEKWPRVLDLPTGAGKTTCVDIALFALALDAQNAPDKRWCPRRIAMVVDRRVVVDQVAERGRKLQRKLVEAKEPVVREVAARLSSLSRDSTEPLDVFTLRGGMPKDDGWARTPDQPLILASTVDQLGSRLLIQGYGVSRGMKPVHAGLLANDLLVLLDEVHLSQAFADTLNALDDLRRRFATSSSLPSRFHHAFLSATPAVSEGVAFRLTDQEKAPDTALGPRLHAPKPATLLEVAGREALEVACAKRAGDLIGRHQVVAVILNRVASASAVARRLRESPGEDADVKLLTGRMRPLDRDEALRSLRSRIMTGRSRSDANRRLIVVGTQCIEAGADFDFDALVTEAASLDALRQRFGRVDRLGRYLKSEAVIVCDKETKDDDPIYGAALTQTTRWLKAHRSGKAKTVDFGVLSFPLPAGDDLGAMVTPTDRAPVLLPAYLDLWMQTSPEPAVVPDVSLWLHGPEAGPPDVQVVWRVDLTEGDLERASRAADRSPERTRVMDIVGAIRPSSLEAISLPFAAARRWLSREQVDQVGDIPDVERTSRDDSEMTAARPVLRWSGDASEVIPASEIKPGDTIVVPATRGGIRDGCFDPDATEPVGDLAEKAALFGRGQPMLRLHPDVLGQLGLTVPPDDVEETRRALDLLAQVESIPWRQRWLERLSRGKNSAVVDADEPWVVLLGRRVPARDLRRLLEDGGTGDTIEAGVELTTDDDDSFHAGQSVTLAAHSGDVECFAREYATAVGLPAPMIEDLALAGWLHDIGKADTRFQILLRGGSEIAFYKDATPLAKSGLPPGARAAHRLAQKRSGYPKGARHEVQSVAMIEGHIEEVKAKAHDIDLVLHLVASHHGYCRPFAPVVVDDSPVDVALPRHQSAAFGAVDFGSTSSKHELHRLDSPLADRFWGLVERYGWPGLCWLEAILRLADHRASEMEQAGGDES